jgi:ABC-type transport system involved in multi-copper enzyme maturation permease subunit
VELNPVLVKELRGRMRGPRSFVLISVYLLILSGAMLLLYIALSPSIGNDLNAGSQIGEALFYTATVVALVEVCFITPLLTSGSITNERERETLDLLLCSLLSPWQVISGKLGAALSYSMLLVTTIVPLMGLAFLFGGVNVTQIAIALACITATAILYACLGLSWSTMTRTSLTASGLAIGNVLLLLLGIPLIAFVTVTLIEPPDLLEFSPLLFNLFYGFICLHPFAALAGSEFILNEAGADATLFTVTIPAFNATPEYTLMMPWVVYLCLALTLSLILVINSLRVFRTRHKIATPTAQRADAQA